MQSLVTFVIIVLLASAVAAGGDRIGRAAAKRKVNVLGMRPRLAARWIAVLTGVVIALGSLLALAALSKDARQMLFHFQELQEQVGSLEARVEGLITTRKRLEADFESLAAKLDETRATLAEKEEEVKSLSLRIEESGARLKETRLRLDAAELEYSQSQERLKEVRAELAAQESENERLKAEHGRLTRDIAALNDYKRTLERTARELEEKTEEFRQENILIAVNQPLAYIKILGASTLPEARATIVTGLSGIDEELQQQGLMLKPVAASDLTNMLNTLSLLTEDMVVIVYSSHNVLPGESVEVSFELAFDRVVFKKGELITQARIGADVGADDLPDLIGNLLTAVRAQALARGILPDITTGEVGTVSSADLQNLAEKLGEVSGERTLEIRAGKDVRIMDKLNSFAFEVVPATEEHPERQEGSPQRPQPS